MTKVELLDAMKAVTVEVTADLILPVRLQKGDDGEEARPPAVYMCRLPDSTAAQKKTPYVIHQAITSKDMQQPGNDMDCQAVIRSIFSVYCPDEQEGGLMLLNLMERLRIALLEKQVIAEKFQLDLQAGIEAIAYPDDTAPYYAGEMISTWKLPPVQRKVKIW